MRTHLFLASALVSVLVACGGKSTTPPAGPGGGDTTGDAPADVAWGDMDHDQRKAFMKDVVMPQMKEMFVAFDAEEFANMDCATCHGEGAADGSFEMPNAGLPVLPATQEGWAALGAEHPKGMEFMAQQVKPAMAKLLGKTEFDPATNTGEFGCHGCHTMEGAPAE